jgi:hypothetical protein
LIRAAVILGLLAASTARADDDEVPFRRMAFHERGAQLVMSGSVTDVFDRETLDRLSNGFVTTVVIRVYLYRTGQEDRAVAFSLGERRIAFDVWDEIYVIRIRDGDGERTFREQTRADALRRATELVYLPVAPLSVVDVGPIYFAGVVVAVNPVSEEILAEVRRWLTRPQGGTQVAGDSSFFGSFVSVFVNPRVSDADRVLRFRSYPVYRVKREKP